MVGITYTPALSYKLEFHWRWKLSGCKVLVKNLHFKYVRFFPKLVWVVFIFSVALKIMC